MSFATTSIRVALTVAAALVGPSAFAQTPDFTRDDYPTSSGTRAVVTGDFDNNGWTDIALANTGRNSVALLMNVQDGTSGYKFWKTYEWSVGIGPFDMTTGDFNRDGVADLAVANADGNTIAIMIGWRGGGMTITQIAAPGNPRGIDSGDFDGDGILDLAYTAYQQNTTTVLFGNGAGGFAARTAATAVGPQAQGVVARDFNNDGRLDLAIANAGGSLSLLTGDGAGHFTRRTVTGAQNINVLTAADLNRDGWLDVAAASQSTGAIGIYLGSSSGLTSLRVVYPAGAASPRGITTGDVNHDGWPDVLAANRASSTVSVLLGASTASQMYTTTLELAAGTGSRDVVTADFDHDGRLDIATGNETSGTTTVFTNTTRIAPGAYAFDAVTIGGAESNCGSGDARMVAADFNHNGRPDVATNSDCGAVVSVLLDGHTEIFLQPGSRAGQLHDGDVNRDGHRDLLVVASPSQAQTDLVAFLGDGRGGFTRIVAASAVSSSGGALEIADVDRDGILDAVLLISDYVTTSSRLQVMLGRGDGTFRAGTSTAMPSLSSAVTLADTNGDARIDALVMSYPGRGNVSLFRGDGAGGFALQTQFAVDGADHVIAGDVNEDGAVDVLVSRWQALYVFAGSKTGAFAALVVHTGQMAQALADMNGDGHLDLVNQVDNQTISLGRGDGIWDPPAAFSLGIYGDSMAIADYNQDGLPDLLFNRFSGYHALINTRRTTNQAPTANAGPDREMPYDYTASSEESFELWGVGTDPDAHALTYEWRNERGDILSREQYLDLGTMPHGSYRYTLTVYDGRGGSDSDDVVVTVTPAKEIVVHMWSADPRGAWRTVEDPEAASGIRAYNPNANAPKITQALASPQNYVDVWFFADPTQTYKLWIRGKAENNYWGNDSAFLQFSGAVDSTGAAAWAIGTTSALEFNLEECSGCGLSGWGWEDDGWGAVNKAGTLFRFPQGGWQRIRLQTREDGLSIDQIVLSAEKYKTTRPGAAKNDKTILPLTQY